MGAGIDWGNTNTVVAFKAGFREHLFELDGEPCVPSYMQYDGDGELVAIGRQAKNALRNGQGPVVAGLKRLIGAAFDSDLERWAAQVYGLVLREAEHGGILVQVGRRWKSPEQMACEFFQKLLEVLRQSAREAGGWLARLFHNAQVEQCVVTCPVQYLHTQKAALQTCLKKAGFQLRGPGLLPEPSAVCKLLPLRKARNTMIVDWGGGTLDFAFVSVDGQCRDLSGVQTGCGGIDMDHAILRALERNRAIPPDLGASDRSVLREFIEQRKELVLSNGQAVSDETVRLPAAAIDVKLDFQREQVARWIDAILQRAQNATDNTLDKHRDLTVERCVLVGGPLCSDYVRGKIAEVLDQDCDVVALDVGPMTAVATGACRQFAAGDGPDNVLVHDYGVMVDLLHHKQGVLLLRGDQSCPCVSSPSSLRLRGTVGRGVEITVFARKINPATDSQTYETSTTFHFLPQYRDGEARIAVALEADAGGAISARVTDEITQREMRLRSVGHGICRPLCGPPARSRTEEVGLWLTRCWDELQMHGMQSSLSGGPNDASIPTTAAEIERYIQGWIEERIPPDNIQDLWSGTVRLAEEFLDHAHRLPERSASFDKTLETVFGLLESTTRSNADENSMRDLLRLLDDLLIWLVRGYGEHRLVPALNASVAGAEDGSTKNLLNSLLRLVGAFEGSGEQYATLVQTVSESRNELERHAPQAKALSALEEMTELVSEGSSLYSRLRRQEEHFHNFLRKRQP